MRSRLRRENIKNCEGGGKKNEEEVGNINIVEREGIQE